MTISFLTSEHVAAATAIESRCHLSPWPAQTFMRHQGQHYLNLALHRENRLAGFLITQWVLDEASLFNLVIDHPFRRQGCARQLLQRLIFLLEEKHINTLWLEVRASNHPAIKLYQQLGFNQVTRRRGYYPTQTQQREDALVMALTL